MAYLLLLQIGLYPCFDILQLNSHSASVEFATDLLFTLAPNIEVCELAMPFFTRVHHFGFLRARWNAERSITPEQKFPRLRSLRFRDDKERPYLFGCQRVATMLESASDLTQLVIEGIDGFYHPGIVPQLPIMGGNGNIASNAPGLQTGTMHIGGIPPHVGATTLGQMPQSSMGPAVTMQPFPWLPLPTFVPPVAGGSQNIHASQRPRRPPAPPPWIDLHALAPALQKLQRIEIRNSVLLGEVQLYLLGRMIDPCVKLRSFEFHAANNIKNTWIKHVTPARILVALGPRRQTLRHLNIDLSALATTAQVREYGGSNRWWVTETVARLRGFTKLETLTLDEEAFCRHAPDASVSATSTEPSGPVSTELDSSTPLASVESPGESPGEASAQPAQPAQHVVNCVTEIIHPKLKSLTIRTSQHYKIWDELARLGKAVRAGQFPHLQRLVIHVRFDNQERAPAVTEFSEKMVPIRQMLHDAFLDTQVTLSIHQYEVRLGSPYQNTLGVL